MIVFQNGRISGALAELIRSTRAPTKDRLIGKIMGGNPAFRGTRVPVHIARRAGALARARAHALPEGKCDPQRVLSPQQFEIFREDWEVKNPLLGTNTATAMRQLIQIDSGAD